MVLVVLWLKYKSNSQSLWYASQNKERTRCGGAIPALFRLFAMSKVKELFLPTYTFEVETFERIYTRKLTEIAAGRRLS